MDRDPAASDAGLGPAALTRRIRRRALELGLDAVGVTRLEPSRHAPRLLAWLHEERHGSMDYLARPDAVDARLEPARRWPELRSAVVVADRYAPSPDPGDEGVPPERGVIARYARGRDYHRVLKGKLRALLRFVEAELGQALPVSRAYVDTGPLLERELAQRAGLGWQGRNTMLIDPKRGSYFFLGTLLLPLELVYDAPFDADRCGSCTACVDACPTGALLGRTEDGAPVMDATRCISYLTIENRGEIPRELRPAIGNRVYGCDICQEVCPWNSPKLVELATDPDYLPRDPSPPGEQPGTGTHRHPHTHTGPSTAQPTLVELMRMTREEWDLWTRGSAIRRAGYAGLKRNVAVAMGNWLAALDEPPEAAVAVLRAALEDDEPLVREHAAWALRQVDATPPG